MIESFIWSLCFVVKYTMRAENKEDVVSESNDGVEFSLTEGELNYDTG